MFKISQILPVIFLGLPAFALAQNANMAQQVLNNLYKNNGNKIILKPKVVIVQDNDNAAVFKRRTNQIEISEKLVKVCRKYGKDSSAAMAWVLGHEFSHAFQLDLKAHETSFLAYSSQENSSEHHEEEADISGGFMAYLSDYKTLEIIEPLIVDIYKEFDLNEKLNGYPSLQERKRTAAKVKKMIWELIHIYELGNYYTAIGKYEFATNCYEYVNKWYKGREIYNNIGVTYAKRALNFSGRNSDQFVFPFELDWNTRMKKPTMSRGEMSNAEMMLRQEYLAKAELGLVEASKIDPELFSAKVNIMTLFVLKGQCKDALDFFTDNELNKKQQFLNSDTQSKDQMLLALALAYECDGAIDKSRRIWSGIANGKSSIYREQALHNLKVMEKVKIKNIEEECLGFKNAGKVIDNVRLNRWIPKEEGILLSEEEKVILTISILQNSVVYSIKTPNERMNIQRVSGHWKANGSDLKKVKSNLLISGGSVYHCESDKYAIKMDAKNNVSEYVKYE